MLENVAEIARDDLDGVDVSSGMRQESNQRNNRGSTSGTSTKSPVWHNGAG